jgi:drug/metabolite transporter (DMT)-like permease
VNSAIAVVTGLSAAAAFAVAALLQQLAARDVAPTKSVRLTLFMDLVRRPLWLCGLGAMLCGYVLQAVALGSGPIALVQPIVATELAFALPLAMWSGHMRASPREWLGIAGVVGGVTLFVVTASPRSGQADPGPLLWLCILAPAAAVIGIVLRLASGPPSPRRAAMLAVNAGICFALVSVLTKSTVHLAGHGAGVLLSHFEPYALVCVGIMAFLFSQSAFQAAPIINSMPIHDLLEPVLAVLIGATALDEGLASTGIHPLLEASGALVACVGVVVLARSKVIHALYERTRPVAPVSPEDHGTPASWLES